MANDLLLSFFGDDFTGSTDAMELLATAGLRTVTFTRPPSRGDLDRYPGLRAFGIAGTTRAMPVDAMEAVLRPALGALRDAGAPIVHYKVCSTFDSSPAIGSIGRAGEVGLDVFDAAAVPIVAGAPSLGRYCVFGNLFARCGAAPEVHRLDRHPTMRRHPVTPMNEADLRLHLGRQTELPIGLVDWISVSGGWETASQRYAAALAEGARLVLIDILADAERATIGRLISAGVGPQTPQFVIGSSGVESVLIAHWQATGKLPDPPPLPAAGDAGPLLVICGSCSTVTARQIERAVHSRVTEVTFHPDRLLDEVSGERVVRTVADSAAAALRFGHSVVLHTQASGRITGPDVSAAIGDALAAMSRRILEQAHPRRVLIAGGDTSGKIAHALGIAALEMTAPLVRGAPLCRATAPDSPADGVEFCFKGGQIGPDDFFERVQRGRVSA